MKFKVGDLVLGPIDRIGYITDVFEHQEMLHIVWFSSPDKIQKSSFSYFNICYRVISNA